MKDQSRHSTISPIRLNRRRLVQGAGLGLAAALPSRSISAADRKRAWRLWQEENPNATPESVEDYEPVALSAAEWTSLTAVVDRVFPKTDVTPGGVETGAHIYIDQKLSTRYADDLPNYQSGLASIEERVSGGFSNASPDEQDAALRDIEGRKSKDVPTQGGQVTGIADGFFDTLLEHTRQGMFCDPVHGGNREFMGWDMIGYPGIKLLWTADDQAIDAKVEPEYISVEKYGGTAQTDSTPMTNATPQTFDEVTELEETDVVMVGIGAAGGIASHVLADAGLKVVAIEAGPRLGNADFIKHYDELQSAFYWAWDGEPKANKEVPTWRQTPDSETAPHPGGAHPVLSNMVGGTNVHYHTKSWRFREDDFNVRSSTVERYGENALPDNTNLADWPITYEELEPYYEKTEYLLGVSGEGGVNPFESPRKNDYPMPPLHYFGAAEFIAEGAAELGYHPFRIPSAVNSVERDGRPACTYCGYCGGHSCWNDSKSTTLVTAIPRAEETGNLEIRTNSRVFRVLTDDNGRASGVEYRGEDGQMYIQPAKLVILSAYTFENIRLLLLSANDQFPDGLANNAGQVGKHFITHTYINAYGVFPGKKFNSFSGVGGQAIGIDDFNGDNFDHIDLGFIRGGVATYEPIGSNPITASKKISPSVPAWGSDYAVWIHNNADSIVTWSFQLETLPYEDNFLDLDPKVVDEDGVPVVRITFDIGENERKAWDYVGPKLEEILSHQGATETWRDDALTNLGSIHDVGGARAGDDPETSVLDKHLLTHEIPNLAVLGGAGYASHPGYNPTQTLQAWAWLAAEYYVENFDEITGTSTASPERLIIA